MQSLELKDPWLVVLKPGLHETHIPVPSLSLWYPIE